MPNKKFNEGALFTFIWVLTIVLSICSGILAWNFVEPGSFWTAMIFLILWGILSKAGHFIVFGIYMLIFDS